MYYLRRINFIFLFSAQIRNFPARGTVTRLHFFVFVVLFYVEALQWTEAVQEDLLNA